MLVFAVMCFILAFIFVFNATETYIKEGKKKAHKELAKAAVAAVVGIVLLIVS